jgi:hypothetical protein
MPPPDIEHVVQEAKERRHHDGKERREIHRQLYIFISVSSQGDRRKGPDLLMGEFAARQTFPFYTLQYEIRKHEGYERDHHENVRRCAYDAHTLRSILSVPEYLLAPVH